MSITLDGVRYVYYPGTPFARTALDGLSLHITRGEIVGITGDVGSGKSTLLQVINGLIKPAAGRVLINGKELAGLKKKSLAPVRRQIGLVFQHPERQVFAYRVYDEIAFGPRNAGINGGELNDRVSWALQVVGLPTDYRERPVSALSAGELRRVAIAGILALQPDYLLLDEPTAGLDREGVARLMDTLLMLAGQQSQTIVMVSHHLRQLLQICNRIIWLRAGRVWLDLFRHEIMEHYDILQTSFKLPEALNVLHGLNQKDWGLAPDLFTPEALGIAIAERLKEKRGNGE